MSETAAAEATAPATKPLPTGRPTIVDAQSFVFWILVAVLVYSGIHVFTAITEAPILQVKPAIGWLALVLWAAYGIAFLAIVYAHQLFVRRSPWITLTALLWGGLAATWFAGQANAAMEDIFSHWFSDEWNDKWSLSVSAATNEESLKLLGIVILVLLPLVGVRSMLDGWFYGMMIGLGFQVVEDYLYTIQNSSDLTGVVSFLWTRGFLGGLWSHAIYTGLVGAGVGYLVSRRDRSWLVRFAVAIGLFLVAWGLHFLWDATFMNTWVSDSPGAQIGAMLLKGVPALVILFLVVRWGREHERKVWTAFVHETIDRDLVSENEARALLGRKSRRAARKAAREAKGREAGRLQKALQYAQLRYVQSVSEEGANSAHAVEDAERVRELKAAIAAA